MDREHHRLRQHPERVQHPAKHLGTIGQLGAVQGREEITAVGRGLGDVPGRGEARPLGLQHIVRHVSRLDDSSVGAFGLKPSSCGRTRVHKSEPTASTARRLISSAMSPSAERSPAST